ncbi:DUF6461 domain-containing protein [Actinoplanes sp. HUAS TT8]|uniref:DUF6461 domain-containing protein n=1 Tax=Actinoplanes sp. HUAS TT8 TaxID=3447453 RepID=UPI003F51B0E8
MVDTLPDEFTTAVRACLPSLAALIANGPAAELGRLGAPVDAGPPPPSLRQLAQARLRSSAAEPAPIVVLRDLGPLLPERLLGALEITVAGLALPALPAAPAPATATGLAMISAGQDSAAVRAAVLAERLRPGVADVVLSLTRRLGASLPPSDAPVGGEPEIAAAHGRHWLALAVAASCAAITRADPPGIVERPAAIAGLAVGAAATVLREAPMPFPYAGALLTRIRDEYLLPRHGYGTVPVAGHRFALSDREFPDVEADFAGNGLIAVTGSGIVVRTGRAAGPVRLHLSVLADPPADVEDGWDEIVEVSWHADEGRASVLGPDAPADPQLRHATPPWPGDYRLRAHARGRDEAEDPESPDTEMYSLVVWAAPPADPVTHRATDRLGHRLRGQAEPARPVRPEHAYRWIRRTEMGMAATVTVVTGSTTAEVLRAFGADPDRPEPVGSIEDSPWPDPWVAVREAGDAVVAVELNGYQGSHAAVLKAASANGRAASMFWNERALTRLSFAERGALLAAFEPWEDVDAEPRVAAVLDGLDFASPGSRAEKGLVAVERFTGQGLTPAMLATIRAGDGFRLSLA